MISFYSLNHIPMNISYKILIGLSLMLTLASCMENKSDDDSRGRPEKHTPPKIQEQSSSGTTSVTPQASNCTPVTPMDAAAKKIWETGLSPSAGADAASSGKIILVNYTLRTCTENGTILDTSREADAKLAGIPQERQHNEPFQTIIGSHQTVPGFEYGLIGMKKGEKKLIAVAAVDGYGEEESTPAIQEQHVPKFQIAPEYTLTLDKSLFADTVTQTIKKELLGDKAKDLKVGQTLTGGQNNDIPAKVMKIDGDTVTLQIDNSSNPFHGKELKAGVTASVAEGNEFRVLSVEGTGVTFSVIDKKSPFYGKYETGATIVLPIGKVTLKAIEKDDVIISIERAKDTKKTSLFFDIEVVDIK